MTRHTIRKRSYLGQMDLYSIRIILCIMAWAQYGNIVQGHPRPGGQESANDSPIIFETLEPRATSIHVSWEKREDVVGDDEVMATLQVGQQIVRKKIIQDASKHVFFDLKPCTEYLVTLQRIGRDVNQDEISERVRTAQEGSLYVSSLTATRITARGADILWVKPSTTCTVTEYVIAVYKGQSEIEAGSVSSGRIPTHPSFKIKDLEPNTHYTVKVTAVTTAGRGQPASIPLTTRKDELSNNGRSVSSKEGVPEGGKGSPSGSLSNASRLFENTIRVTLMAVSVSLCYFVVIS